MLYYYDEHIIITLSKPITNQSLKFIFMITIRDCNNKKKHYIDDFAVISGH